MATKNASPKSESHGSSAGIIILQWLTYAFWGWTVLSLSILVSLVISTALKASSADEAIPYAIAAALVLLPISLLCDFFYARHEPTHKSGASMIVMVIHAVIFAIFAIGSLIIAVFSLVKLGTTAGDPKNTYVVLYSALIIAVIYGLTFLRALNPDKLTWYRRAYLVGMTVIIILMTVLGFVGPVAHARVTRDDRFIVATLPSLQSEITSYASSHDALPTNLDQLTAKGNVATLIERHLVTYEPNTRAAAKDGNGMAYYYRLCANYATRDDDSGQSARPYGADALNDGGYIDYAYGEGHDAGRVCYQIKAIEYKTL